MAQIGKTTIIGGGLIAKSFAQVKFRRDTLILASGVSNSKETRESEYLREIYIIEREIFNHPHANVIYFSTCSLVNGANSRYTRHKLEMEQLISRTASSFHIFRLPQVVGLVKNSTLVSFLASYIIRGMSFNVQRYAKRNLIDVVDVVRITKLIANSELGINSIQNIASAAGVTVLDIVLEIAGILNRNAIYTYTESGDDQSVEIDFLKTSLPSNDIIFSNDYWRLVLQKYVPLYLDDDNQESA